MREGPPLARALATTQGQPPVGSSPIASICRSSRCWRAGTPIAQERIAAPAFPERNWSADWFAWRVLIDFTQTAWTGIALGDWTTMPGFTSVDDEIDNLVQAAQDERADALSEILCQADEFTSYFMNLMTSTPGRTRRPAAYCMRQMWWRCSWQCTSRRITSGRGHRSFVPRFCRRSPFPVMHRIPVATRRRRI